MGDWVRALTIDAHGGLEQLRFRDDLAEPSLSADNDVRVRLHAAALNHIDLWTLRGVPGVRLAPPWIMGNPGISCRACEYCLSGDNPLCLSFQLLGEHRSGTLTDLIVVPEANVRAVPPETNPESAAAFPLAALTAWRMCVTRARVAPGDEVLIWGIGGGVAQMALAICKQRGARTWVTSRSDEKLERARLLGADVLLRQGLGIDIG